jgi:hypothetical protein
MSCDLLLIDIRYSVGLSGVCGCGWCLKLLLKDNDWHHRGRGVVPLTLIGECDMCRLLDAGVGLTANDGFHPRLHRVEGYHHAGLAYVQAINHRQAAIVDRNFPTVAEVNECVI